LNRYEIIVVMLHIYKNNIMYIIYLKVILTAYKGRNYNLTVYRMILE